VSVKKAKGKDKGTAEKSAKKSTPKTKKGKDIVQVRESINDLVKDSAEDIATEVIKVALTGQLATAKYLFEAVGLYPPTEQTSVRPIETTLAHTLLKRMGLPLEPVVTDEDAVPAVVTSVGKCVSIENAATSHRQEDSKSGRGEEDAPVPAEGEE
jgi:hypothetical protein